MVLKLPDQWYVGFANRSGDDAPLGFMAPEGTDSAAMGRKATIDSWRGKDIAPRTIDNKKLTGFKLSESIRRYSSWGNGNVKWRITDPRGFELEISSPNLMQILNCSTIEQGEIIDACIWGREGADNILIPVTSDLYKKAVTDTARQSMKVSLKDVKPGNSVTLQDGRTGVFLGDWYQLVFDSRTNTDESGRSVESIRMENGKKKRYFFSMTTSNLPKDKTFIEVIGSPKVATIDDRSTLSDIECYNTITDVIKGNGTITGSSYDYGCKGISKAPATFKYCREDFTKEVSDLFLGNPDPTVFPVDWRTGVNYHSLKITFDNGESYMLTSHYQTVCHIKGLVDKIKAGTTLSSWDTSSVLSSFRKIKDDSFDVNGELELCNRRTNHYYSSRDHDHLPDNSYLDRLKYADKLVIEATIDDSSGPKIIRFG